MGAPRDLSQGMRGPDVLAVQQGLNTALRWRGPYPLVADGVFGQATADAVRAFQREVDLDPSGVVDSTTRRALFPLAVATVHLFGTRFQLTDPTLNFPGRQSTFRDRLHLSDGLSLGPLADSMPPPPLLLHYRPQTFNLLTMPLAAPRFVSPPAPPGSQGLQWPIHHFELSPGASLTLNPGARPAGAFSLTAQAVVVLGDDDAAHQEIASGFALNGDSNGWNVSWYLQITDVDRFGALGQFHWWAPYAQVSLDARTFSPSLTLAPINLSVDVTDAVTVNLLSAGMVLTYDPASGNVQAGAGLSAGLVVKFGGP